MVLRFTNESSRPQRGSDATVIASKSPFGPYRYVTNLNSWGEEHIKGQSSGVFTISEKAVKEERFVWATDLWFSGESGMKGDDYQYWEELEFVENKEGIPVPRRVGVVGVDGRNFEL